MLNWLAPKLNLDALNRLSKYNLSPRELDQFKAYVQSADDQALYRLNPRYLAKRLQWSDTRTLDVLTLAVAENLWKLEWDTFCPGCGGLLQQADGLGHIAAHQVCPMCQWEGDIILDQMVTVYASLDPAVRKLNTNLAGNDAFRKQVDAEYGPVLALTLVNRPLFREVLGDQVLPHNQSLGVQHLAIFFSDLKSSTALYHRLGDATAYPLVRQHFLAIFAAVELHGGSAVKTIGDGVMGTFLTNAAALLGIVESVQAIGELNQQAGLRGANRLCLKVGLHAGPCIVVTLNHRLDYFGSTVNIASRLSHLSEGDDLLISEAVLEDAEAARIARGLGQAEKLSTTLRGFSTPMNIQRIRLSG
jgi:class 3 adenylate cyclase